MASSENINDLIICFQPADKQIKSNSGETLLEAAHRTDVKIASVCGGRGICKSCVIQYKSGNAPEPSEQDQFFFTKSKLDKGWRRACQSTIQANSSIHVPKRTRAEASRLLVTSEDFWIHPELLIKIIDVTLKPPTLKDNRSDVKRLMDAVNLTATTRVKTIDFHLLQSMSSFLRQQNWSVQVIANKEEIINIQPLNNPILGLAIDLGTTNIAVLLVDLTTGNTLSSMGIENPQKKFGADVIARISQAKNNPEILQQMQQLLITAINQAVEKLCTVKALDQSSIVDIVVAGNTAMHHLFLGLSIDSLGVAPFTAVINRIADIKARELGINVSPGANLHMMDNIAGFVGGDHTAMLLGVRADIENRTVIALDIGTNTEISLIHQGQISSLSSPSGPALEGGNISNGMRAAEGAIEAVNVIDHKVQIKTIGNSPPIGICGSAVLDILSEFHQAGDINFRGQIKKGSIHSIPYEKSYALQLTKANPEILFTQDDVRNVQLAKAAIRAGIDLLLEQAGLQTNDLDKIVIAGAFGAYIRVESAIRIGMLPDLPLERFEQIGNAALVGAKLALLSQSLRRQAKTLAASVTHKEQAGSKSFMSRFMRNVHLPENDN